MSFCTAFTKQRRPCRNYATNNESRCHLHQNICREEWKRNFLRYYRRTYNWHSRIQYKNRILDAVKREQPVFTREDFTDNREMIYFDLYLLLLEHDKLNIEFVYACIPYLLAYIWRQHTWQFIMTDHSSHALSILFNKGGPSMFSKIVAWLNRKVVLLRDNPPETLNSVVNSFFLSLTTIPSIKELVFYDLEKAVDLDIDPIVRSSFESHFLPDLKLIRKRIKQEMKYAKAPIKERLCAEVFHPMYLQKYFDMGYSLDYILDTIW